MFRLSQSSGTLMGYDGWLRVCFGIRDDEMAGAHLYDHHGLQPLGIELNFGAYAVPSPRCATYRPLTRWRSLERPSITADYRGASTVEPIWSCLGFLLASMCQELAGI